MAETVVNGVNLAHHLTGAVFVGNSLPAHDECFDLAEALAQNLAALHAYVASVRSPEQADAALVEMAESIAKTAVAATVKEARPEPTHVHAGCGLDCSR